MGRALGEIFQDALHEAERPVLRPQVAPLRPPWAYSIGVIGGGTFAAGALCLFVFSFAPAVGLAKVAFIGMIAGAIVLGLAWIAALGSGVGGLVPILGCAAVPCGLLYFSAHVADRFSTETTLAVAGLGLGAFVGGHLFARGIDTGARLVCGATTIAVTVAFAATANHWTLPSLDLWYQLAFGGLAASGLALTVNLAFIAHRARLACTLDRSH